MSRSTFELAAIWLTAALTSCASVPAQTQAAAQMPVPGTYAIEFCPGGCKGPETAVARGTLVVEAEPFSLSTLSDSARRHIELRTAILYIADAERSPNACFDLTRRSIREVSYAGLEHAGVTRWVSRPDSGRFTLVLYHSSDASYVAYLRSVRGGMQGYGRSRGGGVPRGSIPDDSIRARYVGPPNRTICSRAAEAEAARVRQIR